MQKEDRRSRGGKIEELVEGDSIHPRGAPRGLLRFYALLSIARKPMRGYDIMREIETKTDGAWRPGPGTVYPVLQKLAKEGLVAIKRKSDDGPTQILYEITPSGLRSIAFAKKTMKSASQRWNMMSSLFLDLMEPDDLVDFILGFVDLQIELVHTIVESEKGRLSDQDKLFVLRQYRLNLERELTRASASIRTLGGSQSELSAQATRKGRA